MKLSVADRIILPSLLPGQDTMINMVIRRDIVKRVRLDGATASTINLREEDGCQACGRPTRTVWNFALADTLEFTVDFTGAELTYLKARVQRLDKEGAINSEILDLCERILAEQKA